jgi:HEAT repeats
LRLLAMMMFHMLIIAVPALAQQNAQSTHQTTIIKLVEIIRAEQDPNYRDFLAGNLPQLVEWGKPESTSAAVINALANLLDDNSDGVRGNAASALGTIGPAAARTAPRLLEAMKRAEAQFIRPGELRPSSFSGDSICEALQRIGTRQQDTPCQFFPGTSVRGAYSGRAR